MTKPKLTQFMPILQNFDYKSNPVGYVDFSNETITLKVDPKHKIKADDVNAGKTVFAPSYIITKQIEGNVTEIVVDSFSLIKHM